jgi:hypothetical protein
MKNTLLALDELIAWIDESDYSDDMEPRLSPEEWQAAQDLAVVDPTVAKRVAFLRQVPRAQVLLPDTY